MHIINITIIFYELFVKDTCRHPADIDIEQVNATLRVKPYYLTQKQPQSAHTHTQSRSCGETIGRVVMVVCCWCDGVCVPNVLRDPVNVCTKSLLS